MTGADGLDGGRYNEPTMIVDLPVIFSHSASSADLPAGTRSCSAFSVLR